MREYIEYEAFEKFLESRKAKGNCLFCNKYERCIRENINRKGSHRYCWEKIILPATNAVILAPMPMAEWLEQELTEYVYKRCMEEL